MGQHLERKLFSRAVPHKTGHQSLRNINTGISMISTVMSSSIIYVFFCCWMRWEWE